MTMLRKMWIYPLLLALVFYALPLAARIWNSEILFILLVVPLLCFGVSVAFGWKNGFHWWFPLLAAALFFPTVFIFYNYTAWVYVVAYAVVAAAGNGIGHLFYAKRPAPPAPPC